MECPKCGSKKVQCTNMGKQALGFTCSMIVGFPVSVISRGGGMTVAKSVLRSICPTRNYICLNPDCKHMFSESN